MPTHLADYARLTHTAAIATPLLIAQTPILQVDRILVCHGPIGLD